MRSRTVPYITYLILAVNVAAFLWLSFTGSTEDASFMAAGAVESIVKPTVIVVR